MLWSDIRIEPFGHGPAPVDGIPCCYTFRLPLLGDGRMALAQFRRNPDRARVERHFPHGACDHGALLLIDNQLTCVWQARGAQRPVNLRVLGSRFALGDKVGLRPMGGVLEFFQVCEYDGRQPFALA